MKTLYEHRFKPVFWICRCRFLAGILTAVFLSFSFASRDVSRDDGLVTTSDFDFASNMIADVTLSTEPVAAANIYQGEANKLVYIVRMDVATESVTLTNFSMVTGGTYDVNDLTQFRLWRHTSASLSGATGLGFDTSLSGNGESVSFSVGSTFGVGTHYLLLSVSLANAATDNNTVHMDGDVNPAMLTFSIAPNLTDNQSNGAGVQTIQAADLTYTTEVVPAANIYQGTGSQIVYTMRVDVATTNAVLTNFSMVTSGTYDNNDFTSFTLYRNNIQSLGGAALIAQDVLLSGTGETISITTSHNIPLGTHYLILAATVANNGTDGNTVHFNGATNPAALTFITSPNITNSQSNNAGVQTIQAADITLSTEPWSAGNVFQGEINKIAYIVRMDVASTGVSMTGLSIVTGGTYDANDFANIELRRCTIPDLPGSQVIGTDATLSGNGELLTFNFGAQPFNVGTHYLLLLLRINGTATDNNTIHFNGSTHPAQLIFVTSPNITNNQSNNAGVQTIQAADVTFSTEQVAPANLIGGQIDRILYVMRMDVGMTSANTTAFSVVTSGTYDANDFTFLRAGYMTIEVHLDHRNHLHPHRHTMSMVR